MNDFLQWAGTVLAAAASGYLGSFLLDRFVLRYLIKDRFSSVMASCTLVFIALMLGVTFYLTSTSQFENGPIIIPPLTTALGLLLAMTFVGVVRVKRYSDAYVHNEDEAVFDPDLNDLSRYDDELNAWDEKNAGRNYFHRHWAGHLSLPISYWVNGALLSALIVAIGEFVARRIADDGGSLRLLSAVALIFLFLSLLAWIWSTVGIWRSAYWHRRRGGSALVGTGVRILVVLGAVGIVAGTGNLTLQARELGSLALGNDPIGSVADMTVSADGRQLVLRGPIAQGAAERFSALLAASPEVETVVLTSEGGRTIEAERMARQIRDRKLDTRVDDHCMSACIHLLLAGADRTAPNRARIGFHQPSFPGMTASDMAGATERMRLQYIEAGIEPSFAWRALTTPAEAMWFPTVDELAAANVITGSQVVIRASRGSATRVRRASDEESLSDRSLREELQETAEAVNRLTPREVDEMTRLDRASASGFKLTYHYTLKSEDLDVTGSKAVMSDLLMRQACDNPAMAAAIFDGASFVYSYSSESGKPLFSVDVNSCRS